MLASFVLNVPHFLQLYPLSGAPTIHWQAADGDAHIRPVLLRLCEDQELPGQTRTRDISALRVSAAVVTVATVK